ncbi:helix-turn-helix transcriptional regulator [Streptosporangiaceae bacterium NEAU-GS5]|nr:helix-turn-helix transcriptional regulator [Streptosporangiaceae bacterium NEAU-GS5]
MRTPAARDGSDRADSQVANILVNVLSSSSVTRLPLREPTYYTLAVLLDGPLHGYGIIKAIKEHSGGRVRLTAGTLYGTLDRLVTEGMVQADGEERVEGRVRRYYRITPSGAQLVKAEAERLHEAARVVRERRPRAGEVFA